MKLENEPGFAQTPPRKSYNPFDSDSEDADFYVENKLNPHEISFEKNTDNETVSFQLETSDISWEEAILGTTITADENGEANPFRKDTQLFTDKTITECELPDLMVCYKENGYHNVKDIVIDEGVPTNDKSWIKSKVSFSESFNGDINGNPSLENESQTGPLGWDQKEDSMKCSEVGEDSERKDLFNQCGGDSVGIDGFKHDSNKIVAQTEGDKKMMGDMVCDTEDRQESEADGLNRTKVEKVMFDFKDGQLSETVEDGYVKVDKKVNEGSNDEHSKDGVALENVKESPANISVMDDIAAVVEPTMDPKEPTAPQSPELSASSDSSVPNDLGYNSKVENGSIILDFNSSQTTPVKENDNDKKAIQDVESEEPPESHNVSVEKPPRPQTMSRNDERDNGIDKGVNGEVSFSADVAPPSSITYVGPNARCGSVSLRSESSTGSTRSFAFPVLQGEWNSSPVRMAKADEKHLHKHRGWVQSVMCCRF